jgi:hypothetical protein
VILMIAGIGVGKSAEFWKDKMKTMTRRSQLVFSSNKRIHHKYQQFNLLRNLICMRARVSQEEAN